MRVVGALFLKETMSVSIRDQEMSAMIQLKHKEGMAAVLTKMFMAADISGDGAISKLEFDLMMEDDEVLKQFALMGLDAEEVGSFFIVLSADDGHADYNEFITGALFMASSAPTLDRLKALQMQMKITEYVTFNNRLMKAICERIGVDSDIHSATAVEFHYGKDKRHHLSPRL